MNIANLPRNTDVANRIVEAQAASEAARLERGAVGWLVGGKASVPNNVAALVALIGVLLIVASLVIDGPASKDVAAAATSLITLSLGFLFGRATKE